MTENLNPLEINEYIFKAAQNKNNIFKSFKRLCEIRKTNLDYVDFEWKYFQFYHENQDLTIETSSENSSSLTFDDLPDEMVGMVVSKLNLINRLKSRKVCRKMLHANSEKLSKSAGVRVKKDEVDLEFDGKYVRYSKNENGKNTVRTLDPTERNYVSIQLPDNYVKRALDDFGTFLEIPKIRIKRFYVEIGEHQGSEEVIQLLKKIFKNRVLHVEMTSITTNKDEKAFEILVMFKPRILREVTMTRDGDVETGDISGLLAMEQFKLAMGIFISSLVQVDANLIFDNFRHFQNFGIRVHSMSVDQIVQLRDMSISEFGSNHFRGCSIYIDKHMTIPDFQSIRRALGIVDDVGYWIFHHYEIPNSNEAYFELQIQNDLIKLEKKAGKKSNRGPIRLVLRKVRRDLREIVDKTNANCKEVLLRFGFEEMLLGWENEYIKYGRAEKEDEFGYEVCRISEFEETKTKELNLSEEEFARMMIADAANFLKTPNQKIGKFSIYAYRNNGPIIKRVVDFLKSLNFKIRATELNMAYNNPFHKILPFFDSNCLKKLCLNDKMESLEELEKNIEEKQAQNDLEKIMKMEIWTKIESFEMDFRLPENFSIEKLFHFKQITIKSMDLTEERIFKIRDILLKTPHFENACFYIDKKMNVYTQWSFIKGIMSQDAAYDSETHRFSIPGSEEYYQLLFGYSCWSIYLCIRRTSEKENSKKENSKKENSEKENSDDSDKDEDDCDEDEDDSDEQEDY